jgi:hypothetical protein
MERKDPMRKLILVVVVVGGCLASLSAEDPFPAKDRTRAEGQKFDRDTQQQIDAILNAGDGYAAAAGYAELFGKMSVAQTRDLKKDPNLGVSLRAAWEEACFGIPDLLQNSIPYQHNRPSTGRAAATVEARSGIFPRQSQTSVVDLDRESVDRFLKFARDQLKANHPEWWETAIRSGSARMHGSSWGVGFRLPGTSYFDGDFGINLPVGTTLANHPAGVLLKVEKESLIIPKTVMDKTKDRGECSLSACLARDRAYVAIHDQMPFSYPLICLDRQSGKVLWESKVWVVGARSSYEGLWRHSVTISVTGERILVHGASCDCAYIEGFDAEKGTALFRFGTPNSRSR